MTRGREDFLHCYLQKSFVVQYHERLCDLHDNILENSDEKPLPPVLEVLELLSTYLRHSNSSFVPPTNTDEVHYFPRRHIFLVRSFIACLSRRWSRTIFLSFPRRLRPIHFLHLGLHYLLHLHRIYPHSPVLYTFLHFFR